MSELTHEEACWIVNHATAIGQLLEKHHPRTYDGIQNGFTNIEDADEVAGCVTLAVAQILQVWLDAGSERENTIEELGPAIQEHFRSWVVPGGGS